MKRTLAEELQEVQLSLNDNLFRAMKTLGIVVLVLGIIMTTVTGFTIVRKNEVLDLGPVEVMVREDTTPVYWSPITGGILIVAGAAFVIASRNRFRRR